MSTTKEKYTDQQLRIIQVIAGVLSAIALIISIWMSSMEWAREGIMQYLFLAVFLVIMLGRRNIERKYRLRLNLYSLVLIDGIVVGILIYAIIAFFVPDENTSVELAEWAKLLIIIGAALLLLIFGVIRPLRKYQKRKEEGTVIPVRLPEKNEEADEENDNDDDFDGPLTIEQKIAAMTKDIEKEENKDQ